MSGLPQLLLLSALLLFMPLKNKQDLAQHVSPHLNVTKFKLATGISEQWDVQAYAKHHVILSARLETRAL